MLMQMTSICLAEPGCYRNMHSMVQSMSGGSGRVEVVALAATDEGDTGAQYTAPAQPDSSRSSEPQATDANGAEADAPRC